MSVVYSAVHRRDGRRVAIKVLPPQLNVTSAMRERFVREARIAAALNHPAIVPVYDTAVVQDIAYFVMPLVEGENVGVRLEREKRLSIADTQLILAGVAGALEYAHTAGVVHRDIKPENIILDATTHLPLLTDFGIARILDDETRLTQDGMAMGTPSYMSPEQALGSDDLDGRSDIYSLGVVGYQMLTGRVPFSATNTRALHAKHASERPVPLLELRPDTPLAMVAAIDGALEKTPRARWQSASAFRDALGELPPIAERIAVAPPPPRRPSGNSTGVYSYGIATRIRHFRRKAVGSVVLTSILGVWNVMYDPSFLPFLFIGGLLGLDVLLKGSALYTEDVPFKALFVGRVASDEDTASAGAYPWPASPYLARCDVAQQSAIRDHTEIRRMLDGLTDAQLAMMPSVTAAVAILQKTVQGCVTEIRDLGPRVNVELEITGSALARLDSAAEAMHEIRLELMRLREERFEFGVDAINRTADRARTTLETPLA